MDFLTNEDVRANDNIRMEPQEYIQSQYSASNRLVTMLAGFRQNIRSDVDLQMVADRLMDVDKASGVALDNLGRIVGIGRTLPLEDGTSVLLPDEYYRQVLKFKMLANITEADIDTVNKLMAVLYDGADEVPMLLTAVQEAQMENGQYYNSKPMHVRWVMDGTMSDLEYAIFRQAGIKCIAAGVGWTLIAVDTQNVFGFDGSELQPFNQGVFWDGSFIDK